MNSTLKTILFWVAIAISGVLLWMVVVRAGAVGQKEKEINFSEFMTQVDAGNVSEVTLIASEARGKFRDDPKATFHTTVLPTILT